MFFCIGHLNYANLICQLFFIVIIYDKARLVLKKEAGTNLKPCTVMKETIIYVTEKYTVFCGRQ